MKYKKSVYSEGLLRALISEKIKKKGKGKLLLEAGCPAGTIANPATMRCDPRPKKSDKKDGRQDGSDTLSSSTGKESIMSAAADSVQVKSKLDSGTNTVIPSIATEFNTTPKALEAQILKIKKSLGDNLSGISALNKQQRNLYKTYCKKLKAHYDTVTRNYSLRDSNGKHTNYSLQYDHINAYLATITEDQTVNYSKIMSEMNTKLSGLGLTNVSGISNSSTLAVALESVRKEILEKINTADSSFQALLPNDSNYLEIYAGLKGVNDSVINALSAKAFSESKKSNLRAFFDNEKINEALMIYVINAERIITEFSEKITNSESEHYKSLKPFYDKYADILGDDNPTSFYLFGTDDEKDNLSRTDVILKLIDNCFIPHLSVFKNLYGKAVLDSIKSFTGYISVTLGAAIGAGTQENIDKDKDIQVAFKGLTRAASNTINMSHADIYGAYQSFMTLVAKDTDDLMLTRASLLRISEQQSSDSDMLTFQEKLLLEGVPLLIFVASLCFVTHEGESSFIFAMIVREGIKEGLKKFGKRFVLTKVWSFLGRSAFAYVLLAAVEEYALEPESIMGGNKYIEEAKQRIKSIEDLLMYVALADKQISSEEGTIPTTRSDKGHPGMREIGNIFRGSFTFDASSPDGAAISYLANTIDFLATKDATRLKVMQVLLGMDGKSINQYISKFKNPPNTEYMESSAKKMAASILTSSGTENIVKRNYAAIIPDNKLDDYGVRKIEEGLGKSFGKDVIVELRNILLERNSKRISQTELREIIIEQIKKTV